MLYQMDEKAKAGVGDLAAAVFAAAAHRLKPIAITTLTTWAGLLPIVLFEDTESIWYPLAVGVTGGLVASSVLLPIYLPMLYLSLHRATERPSHQPLDRLIGNAQPRHPIRHIANAEQAEVVQQRQEVLGRSSRSKGKLSWMGTA